MPARLPPARLARYRLQRGVDHVASRRPRIFCPRAAALRWAPRAGPSFGRTTGSSITVALRGPAASAGRARFWTAAPFLRLQFWRLHRVRCAAAAASCSRMRRVNTTANNVLLPAPGNTTAGTTICLYCSFLSMVVWHPGPAQVCRANFGFRLAAARLWGGGHPALLLLERRSSPRRAGIQARRFLRAWTAEDQRRLRLFAPRARCALFGGSTTVLLRVIHFSSRHRARGRRTAVGMMASSLWLRVRYRCAFSNLR